jgi:lysophospholipase L1-like esterase
MTARGRLLSVVTMVIALAGFVTVGALPAAANSDNVQYVALGDSYAAGVGAPPHLPVTHCLQSDFGYPGVLASGKRIVLQVNATCAGATTTAVAHTVESGASGLNPETRLVTLTVGGNDLGFAGLAGACLAGTPEDCLKAIGAAEGKLTGLGSDLTKLYLEVAEAAPDARIVVTGYPFLVEPSNATIVTAFRAATVRLNDTIEQAVAAAREADVKIVYVDVTAAFAGHGIGSSDPFINDPSSDTPGAVPFHPNADGYVAYADAIAAKLPNGWLDKNKKLV